MFIHLKYIAVLIPFFFSINIYANCPRWIMEMGANIPDCPQGISLLPDTYPASAVVVSDEGFGDSEVSSRRTADFVEGILTAAGDKNPLFLLLVRDNTLSKIKESIDKMPLDENRKKLLKSTLIQVPTNKGYTWQQDYFQSFVTEKGFPSLRKVESFSKAGDSFENIYEAAKACGFEKGKDLSVNGEVSNGHLGGNIEALPGGFCLLGDDSFEPKEEWDAYADQICGTDPKNKIKVPTHWLAKGHTDEILKVIKKNGQDQPCNFSIVLSSPKKALELLKKDPTGLFFNFPDSEDIVLDHLIIPKEGNRELIKLCEIVSELPKEKGFKKIKSIKKSKGVSKNNFNILDILINKLYAEKNVSLSSASSQAFDCKSITNQQVLDAFAHNLSLKIVNDLIEKKMNSTDEGSLRSILTKKLKEREATKNCEPDFIEAPDLFSGGLPVEKEGGGFELPEAMGQSILPGPANSISIENTVFSPNSGNSSFTEYIKNEYEKRGLEAKFIDSFENVHIGGGNIHCSTQTIRFCKPRERK